MSVCSRVFGRLAPSNLVSSQSPYLQFFSARFRSAASVSPQICKHSQTYLTGWRLQSRRCLHYSSIHSSRSYEGDGKTSVTILNTEHEAPLMIDSYTMQGFKLNNGMHVLGPMIIFPKTVLGWDVGDIRDITPESLALFSVLEPKPDVLVIGIGDRGSQLDIDTITFLRKRKINIEVLATEHACTTFNFLSGEGRCCAAIMIPPTKIMFTSFDLAQQSRMRRKKLQDEDDLD